jgi:DNA-binding IclR family transcriptional regulator
MTNSEISRKLGIPKSSASYILRTLEKRGYLARERGTGKYKIGLKALSLGSRMDVGGDLKQAALPVLRRLVERYKLTAHLAVLDHNEAVYIEKVEAPGFIKMDTWVGKRMEVHSTAVGKSIAAHLPSEEVEAIIKERGLRRFTAKTITSRAGLLADLEKVRRKGYSVDDEENSVGARCVAAPVFDSSGRVAASIGVSATVTQIDRGSIAKIAEAVKQAAREVSRQLGYHADVKR